MNLYYLPMLPMLHFLSDLLLNSPSSTAMSPVQQCQGIATSGNRCGKKKKQDQLYFCVHHADQALPFQSTGYDSDTSMASTHLYSEPTAHYKSGWLKSDRKAKQQSTHQQPKKRNDLSDLIDNLRLKEQERDQIEQQKVKAEEKHKEYLLDLIRDVEKSLDNLKLAIKD